ncbi:NADPH-dependent FMN reductase [Myroides sp. LJL110]
MKKVLGFAASTSSKSINKALVAYTLSLLENCQVKLIDLNDFPVPLFSEDQEKIAYPQQALAFLQEIKDCDAMVISMAEHNRNWTAAFKNLFDWCSRKELRLLQDKDILLLSTSGGKRGGGRSFDIAMQVFPEFGGHIKQGYSLAEFYQNFDLEKGIINPVIHKDFMSVVKAFEKDIDSQK